MPRLLAAVLLLLSASAYAVPEGVATPAPITRDLGQYLPVGSAATADGPTATLVNPAGLGILEGLQLDYLHQRSVLADRVSDGIYAGAGLGGLSLGFGYEWIRPGSEPSYRRSTWALALGGEVLSLGAAYHGYSSSESFVLDRLSSWDVGIVSRPFRAIALGFSVLDIDAPTVGFTRFPRRLDFGLGLRPLGERLTVSADFQVNDDKGFSGADLLYAARLRVIDGVTLFGGVTHFFNAGTFAATLGLQLDGANFGLGYAGATDNTFAGADHSLGVRLSTSRFRDLKLGSARFAVLDLSSLLSGGEGLGDLLGLGGGTDKYLALEELLRRAATDDGIQGLVIKLRGEGGEIGVGHVEEIRAHIARLRAAGKPVVAVIESADDADYYLATACDKVYAVPEANLLINGLANETLFLGETLGKIGVRVDVARVGAFKNAPDQLTRSDMSPEQREAMTAYMTTVISRYVEAVSADRKLDKDKLKTILDQGILTPTQAKEAGLIDEIRYPDEMQDVLGQLTGRNITLVKDYDDWNRAPERWGTKPEIGLVRVSGTIVDGKSSGGGLGGGANAGAETLVKGIESAAEDDSVKAIVVRVDSPGGSGSASNLIYRALEKARAKKPVVVSMGNTAASGGYYVALGGDQIFAEPTTLTGSIGVFVIKPDFSGLYDKIGAHAVGLKTNEHADIFSTDKGWSESEQKVAQGYTDAFYDRFITLVAERRKLDKAAVDNVARGRIWSGEDAKQRGLVDTLGSLDDAIVEAKKRAGLSADDRADLVVFGGSRSLLGSALADVRAEGPSAALREAAAQAALAPAKNELEEGLRQTGLDVPVGAAARALRIANMRGAVAILPLEINLH